MALTFFLAVIGWIIFRAESITQAWGYLRFMFTNQFFEAHPVHRMPILYGGIVLFIIEWMQRNKQHALQFSAVRPFYYRPVRWCVYYLILLIIAQYAGTSQSFIYFQF